MTLMPWVLYSLLLQMASSLDAAEFTTFISGFSCLEGFSNNWSGSANSELSNEGVTTYPGLMAHFLHAGTHGTSWQLSPAECNLQCFSAPGIGTHTALINFPTNTLTSDRTCRCYSTAQMAQISIDPVSTGEGFYFCLAQPPALPAQNGAVLELTGDSPKVDFGGALTLIHNATEDKLTCSGTLEASDVRIAGTSTTVAQLIAEHATMKDDIAALKQFVGMMPPPASPPPLAPLSWTQFVGYPEDANGNNYDVAGLWHYLGPAGQAPPAGPNVNPRTGEPAIQTVEACKHECLKYMAPEPCRGISYRFSDSYCSIYFDTVPSTVTGMDEWAPTTGRLGVGPIMSGDGNGVAVTYAPNVTGIF